MCCRDILLVGHPSEGVNRLPVRCFRDVRAQGHERCPNGFVSDVYDAHCADVALIENQETLVKDPKQMDGIFTLSG
jgi:hypothetical protein